MKKSLKRTLALLLTLIMLTAPVSAAFAQEADYSFYLTYSDIQANKKSEDQRYGANSNAISWQQLPTDSTRGIKNGTVYLAKNEREGFQVYFYEKGAGRNLRVEVDEFKNSDGAVLPHSVYNEEYFTTIGETLADALIPYSGETINTVTNENNMLYVELISDKEQPAGVYNSTVTLYDDDAVLETRAVSAVVWSFALPESHYSSVITGLYNTASGYVNTTGFLRQSGIGFDSNGNIVTQDIAKAEKILEGWQETLLSHGVSTYELPRYLIDSDEKAAELAMADTRRKAVAVPLESYYVSDGKFTQAAQNRILQYKALAYGNPFIEDKMFFYVADEPSNLSGNTDYKNKTDALSAVWPGYHAVVPFFNGTNAQSIIEVLSQTADIFCPNQSLLMNNTDVLDGYMNGEWHCKWRYPGDISSGSFEMYRWGKSPAGVFRRIFFWQQQVLGGDGMLYWNCAYFPVTDGKAFDVWENNTLPAAGGVQTGNGNGILLYPSAPKGLPADKPVVSLRLKQISSGLDDYDYMVLAKEFLGEDSDVLTRAVNKVLCNNEKYGAQYVFSCEPQKSGMGVDYVAWECVSMNSARVMLGNALDAVNTEHSYGEWKLAVEPDSTHDGLEIRTCADCGTQQSRTSKSCSDGAHSFIYKDNSDGTHSCECTACGKTITQPHMEQILPEKTATCTESGLTAGRACRLCKAVIKAQTVIAAEGHVMSGWITELEPTCTKGGMQRRECSVCRHEEERPIEAKGHSWEEDYTVDRAATCTAAGEKSRHCKNCDAVSDVIAIPVIEHTSVEDAAVEPTCTEPGMTAGSHCAVCSAVLIKQRTVAPKGHTDNDRDGKCDVCGDIYDEELHNVYLADRITLDIKTPSTTTVNFGHTLILHAEAANIPEGYKLVWSCEGDGVEIAPSGDGKTCSVKSTGSGDVKIILRVVDRSSNTVKDSSGKELSAEQSLTSKAGFFQRFAAFFKKIFGVSMIIPE